MAKDNSLDISDLKNAALSVGDVKDLITVLEAATAHLIVSDDVEASLERLRQVVKENRQ
jgi:hypothetical protein